MSPRDTPPLLAPREISSGALETGIADPIDALGVGVVLLDEQGRIVHCNHTLAHHLGYERHELLRRALIELTYADDARESALAQERVLSGRCDSARRDERLLTRKGDLVWVDVTITPYKAGGACLLASVADIHERKQRELWSDVYARVGTACMQPASLESFIDEILRALVPSIADGGVFEISVRGGGPLFRARHGDVVRQGLLPELKSQLRLRGHEPLLLMALTPPDLGRAIEVQGGRLTALGNGLLYVPILKDGTSLGDFTLVTSEPHRRFRGSDLTHAEELAERLADALVLRRRSRDDHEAIRSRDDVLSIAAHEMRTPLTPLLLALQQLRRRDAQTTLGERTLRVLLDRAERQVEHLMSLVDDLLDVARISSGTLQLRRESVDLSSLARAVSERLAPVFERGGCSLRLELASDVHGEWDPKRLEQVVTNLLVNALKYGGGEPILMSLDMHGETARLSVRDHGIGIAPDKLPRIFERFERAVVPGIYDGLGLGLYISRRIILAHGGDIEVESTVGHGSIFTVTLPRSVAFASSKGDVVHST